MRTLGSTAKGLGRHWISACVAAAAVVLATAMPVQAATFVYVTSATDDDVVQYGVDSGGALSPLNPPAVAVDDASPGIVVSPNGRWVYVTTFASVAQFGLQQGGLLAPLTPPTVPASGAVSVAASPDRRSLYVLSVQGIIFQFNV